MIEVSNRTEAVLQARERAEFPTACTRVLVLTAILTPKRVLGPYCRWIIGQAGIWDEQSPGLRTRGSRFNQQGGAAACPWV